MIVFVPNRVSLGRLLILWGILSCGVSATFAGGFYDIQDSWPVSPAWVRRALGIEESQTKQRKSHFRLTLGQGCLFEMPELAQNLVEFKGGAPFFERDLEWCFAWQKTGQGLFSERKYSGRILVGNKHKWGLDCRRTDGILAQVIDAPVYDVYGLLAVSFAGAGLSGTMTIRWPIFSSQEWVPVERRENCFLVTGCFSGTVASVVIDRLGDGTPLVGIEAIWRLGPLVALGLRADPTTGSAGPEVTLVRGRWMWRTSHLLHPQLGLTHRFSLVVGP